MRKALAAIVALLPAAVMAQAAHVYRVEELAEGVQAQALETAADGKAVRLEAAESLLLAVPVGGGVWRVAITAISLGDGPAAVASLVDDKQPGGHFVPADRWGTIGIGVESGEAERKVTIKLTAEAGVVALDTVRAEELVASRKSLPLREPGKIVRDTPLIEDGRPGALLLLPAGEKYQAAAIEFAHAFQEKTGVELPVRAEEEASEEHFAAQTCIMAGNLSTGIWSLRLYARHLTYSDAVYPGAGGYELRVVHDPWGMGQNVVYLGGSDPEGVRANSAELALACHDNFGDEASFGDAWMPFGSTARLIFKGASLYYREPRCQFMVDRLDEGRTPSLGKLIWRRDLPEQVSGLATLNVAVAAACDDGGVYLISADGEIVAGYREDAPPRHLCAGDLHGAGSAAVIAAYGSRVLALEAD